MNEIKTVREAVEVLKTMIHNKFACDLVWKYQRYGRLFPKQEMWALKLANEKIHPTPRVYSPKFNVANLMSIVNLFKNTIGNLKRPKITFIKDGTPFSLKPSKDFAWIYVLAPEFGGNYYGKISIADGSWIDGRNVCQMVVDFLTDFATDPVAKSQEYGKKSGICCFCHKCLDREESLEVGYGPVCAKNWGLPHSYRSSGKSNRKGRHEVEIDYDDPNDDQDSASDLYREATYFETHKQELAETAWAG